jgi:ABC-type transport system involved in cytochrome c biogenesis permease subunit
MNQKGALGTAWKYDIKPIILPLLLLCGCLILLNFDFNGLNDDKPNDGILQSLGSILVNNWLIILLVVAPLIFFNFAKRRVSPEYDKKLKKVRTITMGAILIGIAISFIYEYQQSKQYGRIVWFVILFGVNMMIYLRKEPSQPE